MALVCFKNSDIVFILLIIVIMPAIVGILTFMGRINSMLDRFEDETVFHYSVDFTFLSFGIMGFIVEL